MTQVLDANNILSARPDKLKEKHHSTVAIIQQPCSDNIYVTWNQVDPLILADIERINMESITQAINLTLVQWQFKPTHPDNLNCICYAILCFLINCLE